MTYISELENVWKTAYCILLIIHVLLPNSVLVNFLVFSVAD